jgi:hypothetical protein
MDSDRRSSAQRPEDERDHRLLTKERYLQPSHKTLYQAQGAEGKDGAREGLSLSELETVARDGIPGRGQVDIRVGLVERASVDTRLGAVPSLDFTNIYDVHLPASGEASR